MMNHNSTQNTLTLSSPAKLNLFLHVTGRNTDGYHTLETFFQLIDLADEMTFTLRTDPRITLDCPAVAGDITDNLIYRAAKLLQPESSSTPCGIHISVKKKIPQGGGLGGGSSNAATTLMALNHLWSLNLTQKQLCALGRTLGADVPVFIQGESAWATGIGDQFIKSEQPPLWFVLVKPKQSIPTADVFKHPDLARKTPACINHLLTQTEPFFTPTNQLWQSTHNDCQPIACKLSPELKTILDWLQPHAAARLTGTGSTCFTIHESAAEAQAMLRHIQNTSQLPIHWSEIAQGLSQLPIRQWTNKPPSPISSEET